MTKVEKRKVLIELRELFKTKKASDELLTKLYKSLEDTEYMDYDYGNHIDVDKEDFYGAVARSDKLTFQECCTWLTFIMRADRWNPYELHIFDSAVENGSIYKLLSRAVETM